MAGSRRADLAVPGPHHFPNPPGTGSAPLHKPPVPWLTPDAIPCALMHVRAHARTLAHTHHKHTRTYTHACKHFHEIERTCDCLPRFHMFAKFGQPTDHGGTMVVGRVAGSVGAGVGEEEDRVRAQLQNNFLLCAIRQCLQKHIPGRRHHQLHP